MPAAGGCVKAPLSKKDARHLVSKMPGMDLATSYFHRTYRPTIIGAEAFHFRVRNGTGWFHLALVTRTRASSRLEARVLGTLDI